MSTMRAIGMCCVVWCGLVAVADAPLVYCECREGALGVPGHYQYYVDAVSYPMMSFSVGTNDPNRENYTNIAAPPGWQFEIRPAGEPHACGLFAHHGEVSEGHCFGITAATAVWWTDDPGLAVETFHFGYAHPWPGEDVGWRLHTRRPGPPPSEYTFTQFWDAPVGTGYGPLHGPYGPRRCWSDVECDETWYCYFDHCAAETGRCTKRPVNCPEFYAPVCGCDGVTYDNVCFAAAAGVSVADFFPCEPIPCWSNDDCDPSFYCRFDECAAETGECVPRPLVCPDYVDPVCGCDGETYQNWCYAARAGVSVDHAGPCEADLCWSNAECDDDHYCYFEECAQETGVCLPRPEACYDVWDPVCGCDGQTYSNACYAAMAGVSVDYAGPCETQYCWSNDDCDESHYCFFHDCLAETGVCMPRPTGCPDNWDPVCGCDGVTYGNACEAAAAGMSVDHYGACEGYPCWSNFDCGPDYYCLFDDCAAETGVCMPRPGGCPEDWDPVCGCDGVTYGNACEAAAAGMTVAHEGPCKKADMNCDGEVDFGDINPFVEALGGMATYVSHHPTCPYMNGDCNGDGVVDFGDINPFVEILSGD